MGGQVPPSDDPLSPPTTATMAEQPDSVDKLPAVRGNPQLEILVRLARGDRFGDPYQGDEGEPVRRFLDCGKEFPEHMIQNMVDRRRVEIDYRNDVKLTKLGRRFLEQLRLL